MDGEVREVKDPQGASAVEAAPESEEIQISEQELSPGEAPEAEETEQKPEAAEGEETEETGYELDEEEYEKLIAEREELIKLKEKYGKLDPILRERGMLDVEDLIESLTAKPQEKKEPPAPAVDADKYTAEYLSRFKPEDQAGIKSLTDFILGHPHVKGAVKDDVLDNYAIEIIDAQMRQDYNALILDHIMNYIGEKDKSFTRFDAPYAELAKHIRTYHQTLLPRAKREGRTGMSMALDFWRSNQKGASKPAGKQNGAGMKAALGTLKPGTGGAPTQTAVPKPGSPEWAKGTLRQKKDWTEKIAAKERTART